MIDSFAPTQKLPLVVGVLFFVTQLIYSLEPLLVQIVDAIGDTLTFVVGGVLIAGSGLVFHRVSSNEVASRRKSAISSPDKAVAMSDLSTIIIAGFILGSANAFLIEYVPMKANSIYKTTSLFGPYFSFGLLGFAAILAVAISRWISERGFAKMIRPSATGILIGILLLVMSGGVFIFTFAGIFLAFFFATMNVSALPYAISKLPAKHITYGVGVFIGSSYILEGILEYLYR